jgi:hypothetical protein
MKDQTPDFTLDVRGVKGFCPVGEAYAQQQMADGTTPVLSCGDPASAATSPDGQPTWSPGASLARACHGESFSPTRRWPLGSDATKSMIDGCFLECHGRALKTIVPEEKIVHIDALPLYKKYGSVFLMDDVPEDERKAVARDVADKIIARLSQPEPPSCGCETAACSSRTAPNGAS